MDHGFSALLTANLLLLSMLFCFARSRLFGPFAGSATNPVMILLLLVLLFNIDFAVVRTEPIIGYLDEVYFLSQDAILEAYFDFTIILAASCAGFLLAIYFSMGEPQGRMAGREGYRAKGAPTRYAAWLFYFVATIATPLLINSFLAARRAPPGTYNYQAFGHEDRLPNMLGSLLPYAAALYAAHSRPLGRAAILSILFCTLLLFVSGGARGPILLMGLVLVISAVTEGRRIGCGWYLLFIPPSAFMISVLGYAFREEDKFASYASYVAAQGGYLGLFFGGEEIGLARNFTIVVQNAALLAQAPFEGFLGLALFLAPRSVFWFKPLGASAYFTKVMAPDRWQWTSSESLVSGFGDLYLQFGTLGAALVMFVTAYFWLRACVRVIRAGREATVFWLPVLIWGMYTFMRGDIFNLGFVLWPSLLVIGVFRAMNSSGRLFAQMRQHSFLT